MSSKVPFGRKLSFAVGGFALNFANLLISQWLLRLYVPSRNAALVSPALFGLIFLVGRVVDGVTDPLVGYWSDHLRSKWGRRKPFVALALVPTALVSALMWFPPDDGLSRANGVFIFVMVQLFFVFWTMLANPYSSLIPELTKDRKERVDITTMQAFFLMFGTVLSAFIGPLKEAFGWGGLGVTVGAVTVLSFLPTVLFVREPSSLDRAGAVPEEGSGSLAGVFRWSLSTFKNRPFVFLLASTSLFWFSLNLMILLVPFWVQHVTGRGDADVVMVMAPYIVANILAFVPCNMASKKFGKKPVFLAGLAVAAGASLLLVFVGEGPLGAFAQTQLVMALYGLATAPFIALPNALLADVVDYDAERTGQRREAIHFGTQSFFQKVAIGLSITASGALMFAGGSGEPTTLGLKLIAALAAVLALAAATCFGFYSIDDRANSSSVGRRPPEAMKR